MRPCRRPPLKGLAEFLYPPDLSKCLHYNPDIQERLATSLVYDANPDQ
jgi:hypothetical protein